MFPPAPTFKALQLATDGLDTAKQLTEKEANEAAADTPATTALPTVFAAETTEFARLLRFTDPLTDPVVPTDAETPVVPTEADNPVVPSDTEADVGIVTESEALAEI